MKTKTHNAGYTLVELMVAIAAVTGLGLLVTLVVAIIYFLFAAANAMLV